MPLFDVYLTGSTGQRIAGTRNSVGAMDKAGALLADERIRGYHAGNRVATARSAPGGVYAPAPDDGAFAFEPWERRGSQIYTEGNSGVPGSARLIAELHDAPNAVELAESIVVAHNNAGMPAAS